AGQQTLAAPITTRRDCLIITTSDVISPLAGPVEPGLVTDVFRSAISSEDISAAIYRKSTSPFFVIPPGTYNNQWSWNTVPTSPWPDTLVSAIALHAIV